MGRLSGCGAMWARRVVATVVDIGVLVLVVTGALTVLGDRSLLRTGHPVGPAVASLIDIVALSVYAPPVMKLTNGQTIGKWCLKLRVECTDRRPMRLYRAAWREVIVKPLLAGVFVSFTIFPAPMATVGFAIAALDGLWPLWDSRQRAVHDMFARTRVKTTPRVTVAVRG